MQFSTYMTSKLRGHKIENPLQNCKYHIKSTFNVARGFAAQKSLRENIPWFFVYSQFNIFSV